VAFEYAEVTGVTQREALEVYARADLVVDQLCVGSHGVFAVEAMSLAKPVLCHVASSLRDRFPDDLPLIQADPDTVTEVLADWLARPADRREQGLRSRAYAEREHDVRAVGPRLAAAYGRLWP
jgi:glycosyltransferase involved in cell wall biosynthesis